MPEGDTIYRAALTLHRALAGRVVTQFETALAHLARVDVDAPIAGRQVTSVEARGKWLHMHFSGGLTLVTHMRMKGSWHIYRPGERWGLSRAHMRAVVHTDAYVAIAFDVQTAEFHTAETLPRHVSIAELGPDLLAPEFDAELAARNLASRPELETGDALLRQSALAGIGNVFKSEVCFAAGVNPFRAIGSLAPGEITALLDCARRFLKANVGRPEDGRFQGFRQTTGRFGPEERLWVYSRSGKPCRKCGTAICFRRQGPYARDTYWCPVCQPG